MNNQNPFENGTFRKRDIIGGVSEDTFLRLLAFDVAAFPEDAVLPDEEMRFVLQHEHSLGVYFEEGNAIVAYIIAIPNSDAAAYIPLKLDPDFDASPHTLYVYSVALRADLRGQGNMRYLSAPLHMLARQQQFGRIAAHVTHVNHVNEKVRQKFSAYKKRTLVDWVGGPADYVEMDIT